LYTQKNENVQPLNYPEFTTGCWYGPCCSSF